MPARAFHFRNIAEEMEWAPRTQGSYWGAILTLMQLGGMAWGPEDGALGSCSIQLETKRGHSCSWTKMQSNCINNFDQRAVQNGGAVEELDDSGNTPS
jgi:hypothetical protein